MTFTRRFMSLLLAFALCATASCAGGVALNLQPTPKVNEGRHFVVLVRTVNEGEFLADNYNKIAGMVYAPKPDPSILQVQVIKPGKPERLVVEAPADQPFGVYVLYTEPGEPWKLLVSPPHKGEYTFILDGGRISPEEPEDG